MRSNCLIEAIKAKIKDPHNVKIHLIPPKLNQGLFHIYWIENGKIFHYSDPKNDGTLLDTILHPLFKGIIKNPDTTVFADMLVRRMYKAKYSFEKVEKFFSKLNLDYDVKTAFEKQRIKTTEKQNIKIIGNLDIPVRKRR